MQNFFSHVPGGLLSPFTSSPSSSTSEDGLHHLQKEMNRFFGDRRFSPSLDIKETDEAYEVSAELPGMKAEDIHLSIHKNTLIIKGEKKSDHEEKDEKKQIYRLERTYGSFYRSIPFAKDINPEKVTATAQNGVLKIHLQKDFRDQSSERKISIKSQV